MRNEDYVTTVVFRNDPERIVHRRRKGGTVATQTFCGLSNEGRDATMGDGHMAVERRRQAGEPFCPTCW